MNNNFYEEGKISSIERVVLAEDIRLPEISKYPLTLKNLEDKGEYKLAFNEYTDVKGKFYLNIMTPLIDKGSVGEKNNSSPSTKGHKGNLATNKYKSSNYITLIIPKYIVLNFTGVIPKGTEFLIGSVGSSIDLSKIRIIGLYTIKGGIE